MNRVSIYQIPVAPEVLKAAAKSASVPPSLVEPLQAMVAAAAHRAAEAPVRIYLCADDDSALARDGFAYVFARSLAAHVPSTVVVDCDFLRIGLSGLVPQPDALGLLDYLLYGSSIGVVTQESPQGVRVVGAGSFPVTRRMPFVPASFEEAARRLAAHARCAVFVGPMTQEDGSVHPLASLVDITIVVRSDTDARPGKGAGPTVVEDSIAAEGIDVWSVRAGAAVRAARPAEPSAEKAATARPAPAAVEGRAPVTTPPPRVQTPRAETPAQALSDDTRYSSLLPRIVLIVFALFVIGFVSWWFWQGRAKVEDHAASTPPQESVEAAPPPVSLIDSAASVAADTARGTAPDTLTRAPVPAPVRPADTGGKSGGTVLVDPSDILVMDDLAARWENWYAIHISSFQESIRAREEVSFLQSREFPVFIVFLDLGPKGKWYRVYAGPFETREEAREVKKNLDAIPQVRFTRITRIPE